MSFKLIVSCCLVGIVGCSGGESGDDWSRDRPPTVPVTGVVTYDGAPLEGATVVFRSSGDSPRAAVGKTNKEGQFTLQTFENNDGAVVGDQQVSITCVKTEGPPPGANLDEINFTIKETSLIPEKYGKFETSGLKANVAEGDANDFIFELEKK